MMGRIKMKDTARAAHRIWEASLKRLDAAERERTSAAIAEMEAWGEYQKVLRRERAGEVI